MAKPQTATNPFYAVLVVVGILFVITAFAYFTMTIREANASGAEASGLITLLSRHGLTALVVELILLAIATFGAMGTDDYWNRRAAAKPQDQSAEPDSHD